MLRTIFNAQLRACICVTLDHALCELVARITIAKQKAAQSMGQRRTSSAQLCMLLCLLIHATWLSESAARGIDGSNKGRGLLQDAAQPVYHFQAWGDPRLLTQAFADGLAQENITGIQAIAAGWQHVSVLRANGSVKSYGFNNDGQLAVPFLAQQPVSVKALAAGKKFTLALTWEGKVLGWGDNSHGQLDIPIGIQSFGGCAAIAAGWDHSLCLMEDNTVVTWGKSQIPFPYQNVNFTAITADVNHNMGILSDTSVRAWDVSDLADGLKVQPPTDIFNITHIATGLDYGVIVQSTGYLAVYGNTMSPVVTNFPSPFPTATIKQIFSGDAHVLMLLEDNSVWAWGDGSRKATDVGQGLIRANAISAGSFTSFALSLKPDAASLPPPTLSTPPSVIVQPPPLLSSPPPIMGQPPPLQLSPPPLLLQPPPVPSQPPPILTQPPPLLSSPPPVVQPPPPILSPPPAMPPPTPSPQQVALPPPTTLPSPPIVPSPTVAPNPGPAVISVPPPAVDVGVPPPPPAGSGIIISQSPPPAPDSAVTASGTASSSHTTSAGAVAGGVIGGIVAAAALAVLAVWLIRRPGKNGADATSATRFLSTPPAAGHAAYSYDGAAFVSVPITGVAAGVPPARLSTLAKSMSTPWYRSLLPSDRLNLALHAAKGMRYMHEQGLKHGAFNTANLLFEDDGTRVVIAAPPTGSQPYAAANKDASIASITPPEILTNPSLPPSEAADVYAFGIVLLEIMTGSPAYPGMRSADIKSVVLQGSRPDIPGSIDDLLAQTIISCWDQDPESRPPIYNVVAQLEAVLSSAHRV